MIFSRTFSNKLNMTWPLFSKTLEKYSIKFISYLQNFKNTFAFVLSSIILLLCNAIKEN